MKIQGRKSTQISSLGPMNMPAPAAGAPAAEPTASVDDSVELASAQQLRTLQQAVQAMPSVRTEKVEVLRGAIEEGSYFVESDKLARKVVDEVLTEALLQVRAGA